MNCLKWLIFIIFCLFLANLPAQIFSAKAIVGINISQVDGDKLSGYNKVGLNIGLGAEAKLSDRWSLSTEFLFSEQGANAVPNKDVKSLYDKISLKFVEVPFMINFSDWKIKISGGFSFNRLTNYEVIDFAGIDITELETYNTNIFAGVIGGTVFFTDHLALNIRLSKYMTNLREPTDIDIAPFFGRNIGMRLFYII